MQDLDIDDFKSKPPDGTCASSQFSYNPACHVITGDLNIVNNTSLRNAKYHEPKSINWKYNFKILMDSVEDYARKWAKREWIKAVRSLIQIKIKKLNGSINAHATSIFKDPNVAKHLSYLHDKYVVVPAD